MNGAGPPARYGLIAGTEGAAAIQPDHDRAESASDRALAPSIDDALAALRAARARFVLAELPDDGAHADFADALRARGFADIGRIAGYVDDDVDLIMLRLEVT